MSVPTSRPVVLLLGSGSNTGAATISHFTSHGFCVVAVSRSASPGVSPHNPHLLNISADLSDPSCIPTIFSTVKSHFGTPPTIVIYNAASRTVLPPTDPIGSSFSLNQYNADTATNVTSALLAAHHTILNWQSSMSNNDENTSQSPPANKTFIYNGNKLPRMSSPPVLTFGMHKTAMLHCMRDLSMAYGVTHGWKFYFTDERTSDGEPARENVSGEAAAEEMSKLVLDGKQRAVYYSFVKGKGYRDFERGDWEEEDAKVKMVEAEADKRSHEEVE